MELSEELMRNYTTILKEELVAAMGCTEPIAIAYAAAKARNELGEMPEHMLISCSGNMIKNVKGVTVPNSGGQKGIETAAVLGAVGGNADKMLEVIADVDDEARELTRKLVAEGICDVTLAENVPNLYIKAEMWTKDHKASVTIEEHHTDITQIVKDGENIFIAEKSVEHKDEDAAAKGNRAKMTLQGIIDYANTVNLSEVEEVLERQVRFNTAISQEGLDNPWGARVGKTMLENWSDDVKCNACARAARKPGHHSNYAGRDLCGAHAPVYGEDVPLPFGLEPGVHLHQALHRFAVRFLRRGQCRLRSRRGNHIYGRRQL